MKFHDSIPCSFWVNLSSGHTHRQTERRVTWPVLYFNIFSSRFEIKKDQLVLYCDFFSFWKMNISLHYWNTYEIGPTIPSSRDWWWHTCLSIQHAPTISILKISKLYLCKFYSFINKFLIKKENKSVTTL